MLRRVQGFRLRRRLSGGEGTTEVWEALRGDGVPVALKLYLPREDVPEGAIRFKAELDLLARFGGAHHLIRCLGSVNDDPSAIVLEWASKGNLRDRLYPMGLTDESFPFDGDLALAVAAQIGDALGWLHSNEVVHRDVKPSNILTMEDGSVRLADLSVAARGRPPRGLPDGWVEEAIGTLGYTAPELLRDPANTHPGVDVYSLGATLYELLTGTLPHDLADDEPDADYRDRIAGGEPPVPLSVRRWAGPERLGRAVMGALDSDPARRLATVADLLDSAGV